MLAFFIFVLLQQAPYQPELSRLTDKLGLDDQQVAGRELHVRMSPDGHFWVLASLNGVTAGGWTSYAKLLEDAGADGLELHLYHAASDMTMSAGMFRDPSWSRP